MTYCINSNYNYSLFPFSRIHLIIMSLFMDFPNFPAYLGGESIKIKRNKMNKASTISVCQSINVIYTAKKLSLNICKLDLLYCHELKTLSLRSLN